jgi:predicted ATPase/class 3 adenylate cyclase
VRDLPTGTVTFLFSDIEGSTRLLEALKDAYPPLLERHRAIVRDAIERHAGVEVGTQGDSFFAVFRTAADAVEAAVDIERELRAAEWPEDGEIRVRIGIHTGEGIVVGDDYVGLDVHRAARIMAAGHGGQVLVSATATALVGERADGISLRDLGLHRLRDLSAPERLFQVVAEGLADEFPGLRSLDAIPNNLPTQVTRLVGREAELQAIRDLLSTNRLVTLTGPGGIGKTTLALHAAADSVDRFPDGAWFVDLSDVRDADAALASIVRSVRGLAVAGSVPLLEGLAAALAGRSMLLVLDNFEQVVAAAADVAALLARCEDVTFLVTSRAALHVRGERVVPIAPLSLPATAGGRRSRTDAGAPKPADVASVATSEAVVLFVERAREARPEFELTDGNAPIVAELCARLDGLPLAIELAAARLRLFSLEELRERLRLELLRGGPRDLPERQRALRATIDWSHELLDPDERALFALLSLFSGARIDAVEDVASRLDALRDVDVIDRLASLVDKSLVRRVDEGGQDRLVMLETIREYAAERLAEEPGLQAAGRRAHAEHYAAFAAAHRNALRGRDRALAQAEVTAELGNVMAAWRTLVEAADLARLNDMLHALWGFHEARGWYHEAIGLTNDLLGVLASVAPSPGAGEEAIALRLSLARGLLAIRGYRPEIESLYRDALALTERAGGLPPQLAVLRSLASYHLARGELDREAEIGRQMLELGEREGDVDIQVEGHVVLGPALTFLGDRESGTAHLERAIELFDPERHGRSPLRLGPNPGPTALVVSALFRWAFGFPEQADRYATSGLELATRLGHPYSLTYATFHVALLDLWNRRVESARARAAVVRTLAEERDYPLWRAIGLALEGVTVALLGDPTAGPAMVDRGIAHYEATRAPPIIWPQVLSL